MSKAMLISVGGSPQPIVKSITHYKPEYVSFFVSQQTSGVAIQIVNALRDEGISVSYEQTLCDKPDDLLDCYRKSEGAVQKILNNGYDPTETVVDYTGGTKNMSVAIALASIKYGFTYSYVGGKERTKDGVGIVIDGQEEISYSLNPWDFLAINEKERIATLFNSYQFKSAKAIAESVTSKTTKYKALYRRLVLVIEGFYRWDLFCHEDALRMFERSKIDEFYEYDDEWIRNFAKDVSNSIIKLKELLQEPGKPTMAMIYDLFSNAERRYEEGKIDDAILRLYRIVEMIAQMRLSENYGINVSDIRIEQIPETIREEYQRRYLDEGDNKIKISQNTAFLLLKELDDEVGDIFVSNEKRFKAIQFSRNNSYLAHGFQSSTEKTYNSLKDFVLSLNIIESSKLWQFPKII